MLHRRLSERALSIIKQLPEAFAPGFIDQSLKFGAFESSAFVTRQLHSLSSAIPTIMPLHSALPVKMALSSGATRHATWQQFSRSLTPLVSLRDLHSSPSAPLGGGRVPFHMPRTIRGYPPTPWTRSLSHSAALEQIWGSGR